MVLLSVLVVEMSTEFDSLIVIPSSAYTPYLSKVTGFCPFIVASGGNPTLTIRVTVVSALIPSRALYTTE